MHLRHHTNSQRFSIESVFDTQIQCVSTKQSIMNKIGQIGGGNHNQLTKMADSKFPWDLQNIWDQQKNQSSHKENTMQRKKQGRSPQMNTIVESGLSSVQWMNEVKPRDQQMDDDSNISDVVSGQSPLEALNQRIDCLFKKKPIKHQNKENVGADRRTNKIGQLNGIKNQGLIETGNFGSIHKTMREDGIKDIQGKYNAQIQIPCERDLQNLIGAVVDCGFESIAPDYIEELKKLTAIIMFRVRNRNYDLKMN